MVLDWIMPGMLGVEICGKVHQMDWAVHSYIILLTAKGGKGDLVAGFEAGAGDYVSKPFDPAELKVRLQAGQRIQELQVKLLEAEEALRHQATHDALTNLPNRRAILAQLERQCSRAQRGSESVSVVIVDLDHFKSVNDNFGHRSGDAVLTEAANRMAGRMRSYEDIGRYGGEEFFAILAPCDLDGAVVQAQRFQANLANGDFEIPGGKIPVTAGFGVATATGKLCDLKELIHQADLALYQAKADGRNRIRSTMSDDVIS